MDTGPGTNPAQRCIPGIHLWAPKTGKLSQAYFAKLKVKNNQPVSYFAVGGWELSNEAFKDSVSFRKYVLDLTRQIAADVEVQVK